MTVETVGDDPWRVVTTRQAVTIRREASPLLRPVTDRVYWTWVDRVRSQTNSLNSQCQNVSLGCLCCQCMRALSHDTFLLAHRNYLGIFVLSTWCSFLDFWFLSAHCTWRSTKFKPSFGVSCSTFRYPLFPKLSWLDHFWSNPYTRVAEDTHISKNHKMRNLSRFRATFIYLFFYLFCFLHCNIEGLHDVTQFVWTVWSFAKVKNNEEKFNKN